MGLHLTDRLLVTGGCGFLGSHLCERLLADGAEVICVDNFFTGTRRNVEHLLDQHRFELLRHDITFPLYVEVDQIYNLACPASPISLPARSRTNDQDERPWRHQYAGPRQTTASAHPAGLDLGSVRQPHVHPQTEDYWGNVNPIGPRSCYDEGKRCAETLFFDYRRQHGFPIKVARIFNTYGPRMHPNDGRVVSNFIVQALLGKELTIYGDGTQTRAFCYVDELVDGLVRLMNTPASVTGPFNIGNPAEISINELARMVIELTGSRSRLVYKPLPADDPRQRQPDITRISELLDWRPRTRLEDGLRKTTAYFEQLLNEGVTRSSSAS